MENLRDKNLRDKNLRDRNLRDRNLRDRNLRYRNLRDKNLRDKNLRDRNLRNRLVRVSRGHNKHVFLNNNMSLIGESSKQSSTIMAVFTSFAVIIDLFFLGESCCFNFYSKLKRIIGQGR